MSPDGPNISGKIKIPDNLYTIILALAALSVLATALLVTYKCYMQYGTIFGISS